MEIIYVLLSLVVIYLQVNGKNTLAKRIVNLESKITDLQFLLKHNINSTAKPSDVKGDEAPDATPPAEWRKPEVLYPTQPSLKSKTEEPPIDQVISNPPILEGTVEDNNVTPPLKYKPVKMELSFFERHPDLEKFIGENLINKIGIAVLVLAIGFFVKYAIDNNWIGPIGRVGSGVLFCGILIAIAHRMRNSYTAFSSVLVGGGLAILYFTITLAYHQFHLFNQTTSFIILIMITCFAVVLSLLYNKQELAVIALVGGLSSPLMVSGDKANYDALFIYLLILNTGLLVIAYRKSWRILNVSAFGLTVLVFLGIIFAFKAPTYITSLIYGTLLYLLFFAINVANNVKENKKFIASDFTILLLNTALYFSLGLYLLTMMNYEQLRGVFSASLAFINLILSYILFKNKKVDTSILYLLIGITLTFISLTAPIQLHGHNITLFWAAESVLLYWLYLKSKIQLIKLTSLIVWGAMLISLLIDWSNVYGVSGSVIAILANKGFITTVVAAISSYGMFVLINQDEGKQIYNMTIPVDLYRIVSLILLFLSGLFEVDHQFVSRYPQTELNNLYLMLYVPAFVYTCYMLSKRFVVLPFKWVVSGLILAGCVTTFLMFYPAFARVQYAVLVSLTESPSHFVSHWLADVFIGLIFYQLISLVRNNLVERPLEISAWVLTAGIVLFLSLELNLISNQLFYSKTTSIADVETVFIKVGLPIIWGLSSFALMWLGMRNKVATLRIISLTLFSITLIKLFVFDIQNIPPAGKIAAFFCLGVLLLIVSFMYQRVKKIIVEDEPKHND